MNPKVKNTIAYTLVVLGLICIARGVLGAEPFKAALIVTKPGQPPEVRHLFDSETACNLDLASTANVVPKATKLKCERRK